MKDSEEKISKQEALSQIQAALRRAALLYHCFSETLVEEYGQEKGVELIRKAIDEYGSFIGGEARIKAQTKGLSLTPENFTSDLPDIAWEVESIVINGEETTSVENYSSDVSRDRVDFIIEMRTALRSKIGGAVQKTTSKEDRDSVLRDLSALNDPSQPNMFVNRQTHLNRLSKLVSRRQKLNTLVEKINAYGEKYNNNNQ